jgi:hypothetical protein
MRQPAHHPSLSDHQRTGDDSIAATAPDRASRLAAHGAA